MSVHYFILDAFAEIALLDAASADGDRSEAFFARTTELRELFKFEFYLPRSADYRSEIERRVSDRFGDWEAALQGGEAGVREAFDKVKLLVSHAILRSFADAYRVVASVLAAAEAEAVENKSSFLSRCLKTGKQELLQGRVFSAESISKSLYETGWKLAEYRGLLAAGDAEARREFHDEFRQIKRRLDEILAITMAQADQL
jgi:glycerol-3-phosphate O-acyltransferase